MCGSLRYKAIEMVSVGEIRTENKVLRRAERPLCKECDTPLISAAELEYIARQLGNPEWLAYCLDCRPLLMERQK